MMWAGVIAGVCGALGGATSMLVYGWLSNQARMTEIAREIQDTHARIRAYEGDDFSEVWPLMRHGIQMACARLQLAVWPALASGLPVLAILCVLHSTLPDSACLPFGPRWARGWLGCFLAAAMPAALWLKIALRIQ